MEILRYSDLQSQGLEKKINKVEELLRQGDFRSADVKKLSGRDLYRAKLDDKNRLLFKFGRHNSESYLLLLEVIQNHRYEKSRFLRGASVQQQKFIAVSEVEAEEEVESLKSRGSSTRTFNVLDKIIVFDERQSELYELPLPIAIVGSAGSGKTAITLEKMKRLTGDILYVTQSPYLVESSRNQYFSHGYGNDKQEVEFLSYWEFLQSYEIPRAAELQYGEFVAWYTKQNVRLDRGAASQVYEEFKGVITGSTIASPHLSRLEYLGLGVKQTIFLGQDRERVFSLFEKFLDLLRSQGRFELNMLSQSYIEKVSPKFDSIVIDEVQDLTPVQIHILRQSLKNIGSFLLCGDSNQIVHPNFFSWAQVKSSFHAESLGNNTDLIRVLTKNYRSSNAVTALANKILRIKTARFGSIDKESNYLIDSPVTEGGHATLLRNKEAVTRDLNLKTKGSTKFAILVMEEEDKAAAKKHFQSPLIFSVREAKGLEYPNIILFDFVGSHRKEFDAIVDGVDPKKIRDTDLTYSRAKDKSDKSLEVYKFYINALYVATTRSITNLYIVDSNIKHSLFDLLELAETKQQFSIKEEKSSHEDWQREARKLEKQGKTEQAAEIRKTVLKTEPVPWVVLNKESFETTYDKATNIKLYDKKSQRLLHAYGFTYHDKSINSALMEARFGLAGEQHDKAWSIVAKRFFPEWSRGHTHELESRLQRHGVDYLNPMGQTPIMVAVQQGRPDAVEKLVYDGANLEKTDLWGASLTEIALKETVWSRSYTLKSLPTVFEAVAPGAIKVKVNDRLIKLDKKLMEYFLLTYAIASFPRILFLKSCSSIPAFESGDFAELLEDMPENVLMSRRKKRSYISSILAKNEVHSNNPYNRQLFLRIRRGFYLFNPDLEIDREGQWVNIYDLLGLDFLKKTTRDNRAFTFLEQIEKMRQTWAESTADQ